MSEDNKHTPNITACELTDRMVSYAPDVEKDFFADLIATLAEPSVRIKYRVLQTVLTQAVNQKLRDTEIAFGGMFARIDYLLKENKIKQSDRSLYFAVNEVRIRMKRLDMIDDESLTDSYAGDLRAVAVFVGLIYNAEVPTQLKEAFHTTPYRQFRQRMKDDEAKNIAALRCIVSGWDGDILICTREDTGEDIRVDYLQTENTADTGRSYLKPLITEGTVLSLVRPRTEGGVVYPELVIVSPDLLINVTSVAACFEPFGHSPLADLLNKLKPSVATAPILLGNFASQLLDEAVYGEDTSYEDSIKAFFKRNALDFLACADIDPADFHRNARQQRQNIRHIIDKVYAGEVTAGFKTGQTILEPSFFSPMLGLQGRMDFLDLGYRVVIEQKSGKGRFSPGCPPDKFPGPQEKHLVQLLLYRALLHYDYRQTNYDSLHAFLLYSKYADGLSDTPSMPALLSEAIKVRNQIAWCEQKYARDGMGLLATLKPERLYPDAHGPLWDRYTCPQLRALLDPVGNATPTERSYYLRFMKFIATEHLLSRLGNTTKENSGFASTWNSTVEEKRQAGNIYEQLGLEPDGDSHIDNVILRFDKKQDADMSNFRTGDIVFFYPYRPGDIPDATKTMVFRATLTDITATELRLKLRNPQTDRSVFDYYRGCVWAVEHDFMEASYGSLYRAMHSFLSATQSRRDLLMNRRRPAVDPSVTLQGDYAEDGNDELNRLVLNAMRARDLFIVIGPPGTGKTSFGMKNILDEQLLREGTSVLLLSYTNRAVDEICSKLIESAGGPIDFIRIGNDYGCEERYRPYLLSSRIEECSNIGDVDSMIRSTRVFCGTTAALNSNISLLRVKRFDLAIVDEASQILEPHILGLLSARQGDTDAIGKFVFIGDEKQLPAVVQQTAAESRVDDPGLQDIGLTDCALSLFERMLRLYGRNADGSINHECCFMLTRQGRMHPDIAGFPNRMFYGGALGIVPLCHQLEPGSQTSSVPSSMDEVLASRRMAFIDCSACGEGEETDKVNRAEADVIARVVVAAYKAAGKDFDITRTVGVIVPYRNQISTVRNAISAIGGEKLTAITIDTVERYQGSQRDVIVYGFTVKWGYQLAFLTNNEYVDPTDGAVIDRKLNVAMTRARRRLVLTGNASLLNRDTTFRRLVSYAKEQKCFFQAEDLKNGKKRGTDAVQIKTKHYQ